MHTILRYATTRDIYVAGVLILGEFPDFGRIFKDRCLTTRCHNEDD